MSQTAPPTVDPLPPAPNTSSPSTFATLMDAFLAALIVFRTQLVALATNVYNNALDAYNSAGAAAAAAAAALGYANNAASSATAAVATANATVWASGATVAQYANVISPLRGSTHRRITATGSGTTDPALDPVNYVLISNFAYMQTADQPITAAGSLTIAHGLGRAPLFVQGFMKNTSAERGYAPGDIAPVALGAGINNGGTVAGSIGVSYIADATNLYVKFAGSSNTLPVVDRTDGNLASITDSKWTFFLRALA
jgi:hypothetical protein